MFKGFFYGEKVVIVVGLWVKCFIFFEYLGYVFFVKGECIVFWSYKLLFFKMIFLDEGFYLVFKIGGRIVIGVIKL